MTTTTTLTGLTAIGVAREHGLTLSKYADPVEDAREGLSPDEAREIALIDPSLIYLIIEDESEEDEVEGEAEQPTARFRDLELTSSYDIIDGETGHSRTQGISGAAAMARGWNAGDEAWPAGEQDFRGPAVEVAA